MKAVFYIAGTKRTTCSSDILMFAQPPNSCRALLALSEPVGAGNKNFTTQTACRKTSVIFAASRRVGILFKPILTIGTPPCIS